ncbi:MAG: hypothetical protein D6775_00900, partial [Caldilineae bacterium]
MGLALFLTIGLLSLVSALGSPVGADSGSIPIRLRGVSFDPLRAQPMQQSPEQASGTLYLIQFQGPIHDEWKQEVAGLGVRLYDYIPEYAFVARMKPSQEAQVAGLPFVRWVGPYRREYRLPSELQAGDRVELGASNVMTFTLMAAPDADMALLEQLIARMGGALVRGDFTRRSRYVRLTLLPDRVSELASSDDVLWIEPYYPAVLYNDVGGGQIMRANRLRQNLGLFGSGQIVAVADTGLDVGTTGSAMSDDFEGRIVAGQPICAYFEGGRTTWSDFNGHGTHVAGSVLGSGILSGSNPAAHVYDGSFAGVAPEARLVFQSIDHAPGGGLECLPPDLPTYLFGPAYDQGARIHTNSWGGPTGGTPRFPRYGGYDTRAQQVDAMMWEHPDLLILFAAGNAGEDQDRDGVIDLDSMASPGTAKNVITVGASESMRPEIAATWGQAWPDSYRVPPVRDDRLADNINGMAAFSSRGPADDGRIKPDLVAPGTAIISARSHDPQAGTGWGEYDGDYIYDGGTSMATPLTAGAAALVREWLVRLQHVAVPSAALIKALLINGTAAMAPGQYGHTSAQEIPDLRPNNVSGWGRVDLEASINPDPPQRVWFAEHPTGLGTGQQVEYTFTLGGEEMHTTGSGHKPGLSRDGVQAEPFANAGVPLTTQANQLLQNPGFESGSWTPWQTSGDPRLQNQIRHGGNWAAQLGGRDSADDQIWQGLHVPMQAGSVTLRFWYRLQTQETYEGNDRLCYGIWNESGTRALVLRCADLGATGNQDWREESYSLKYLELLRVLGRSVLFGFFVDTDGSRPSTVWLDDAGFEVPGAGSPTATPTAAPPTSTPTPGGPG